MTESTWIFPLCLSWPMGFSWSSFVAQSVLLGCCTRSGLGTDLILAEGCPVPARGDLTFALATDDVMVFNVAPEGASRPSKDVLSALDAEIARRGIQAASAKDVDDEHNATCIGVDVDDGRFLAPNGKTLLRILIAVAYIADRPAFLASPLGMSSLLGSLTWFACLNRPSFSAFDLVYAFVEGFCTSEVVVPPPVVRELVMFCALAPLLECDLTRPWSEELVATDASVDFGYGVAVAQAPAHVVREIGRFGERHGRFVRLTRDGTPGEEAEKPRQGVGMCIPLSKGCL